MSDAAAPAKAPVKKAAPKAKKPKAPATHPKYSEMVKAALGSLKERGGSSRQAILKYILKNFDVGKDEKAVNSRLKLALRAGVKNNGLKQAKGSGASGSFKLGEVKKAPKPKKAKKAAKPKKAKTPKKAAKPKKAKSPKKAAKPKKVKTPKKAKVVKPKKAVAAKKPAAAKKAAPKKAAPKKKPAAKKAAAKK